MYAVYAENLDSLQQPPYFDPAQIRGYELCMDDNFQTMIRFIAMSSKHKMFREDDGSMIVVREDEAGSEYFYGQAVYIDEAIEIFEEGHHKDHASFAQKLREFAQ